MPAVKTYAAPKIFHESDSWRNNLPDSHQTVERPVIARARGRKFFIEKIKNASLHLVQYPGTQYGERLG